MKRQLKFRAWDKGQNKWLLGYEYPNLGGFSLFGEVMLMSEWSNILNDYVLNCKTHNHNEDDLVVMQFTGLTDCHGKEVYENDIVLIKNKPYPVSKPTIVRWSDKSHGWSLKCDVDGKWVKLKYYSLPASRDIEVIGNIYENESLVK
jgi:uncharacterized phage protein (TIGR01671 family)